MDKPFNSVEIISAVGIRLAEMRQSVAESQQKTVHRQELFEAQIYRGLAEQRAEIAAAVATLERTIADARDRLATLKDGVDGKDGARGAPGDPGPEGPPGQDGKDGAEGRSFNVRGTWLETENYSTLDVVMLNGASFAAKRDDPGPCPGDGWQLFAAQGKRGNAGERGPAVRGERGLPGAAPAALAVDDDGLLTLTNGDGSQLTCDLYPLLSRLVR